MARNQRTDSMVVFAPTVLKLRTVAHRASLDGNQASILSGRDPMEYGSIGRMPGGKRVASNLPAEAAPAYKASYYQRRGVVGGHMISAVTTTATGALSTSSAVSTKAGLGVSTTAGFEIGQWVVIYNATNSLIGRITAVGVSTIDLEYNGELGDTTTSIVAGANVVVMLPGTATLAASATSATMLFACDLQVGMTVVVIGQMKGATTEEKVIKSINGVTVSFTTALSTAKPSPWVILPKTQSFTVDEVFVSQGTDGGGTYSGNLYTFSAGAFKKIWDASDQSLSTNVWRTAVYDRSVLAINGKDTPKRISVQSSYFDPTVSGQLPPVEAVGYPSVSPDQTAVFHQTGTQNITVATTAGTKTFIRMIDRSVVPTAFSPPLYETMYTSGNINNLDASKLFATTAGGLCTANYVGNAYRRGSYFQIWQTTSLNGTFFLAHEHHVSVLLATGSAGALKTPAWQTQYSAGLLDGSLKYRTPLALEDYTKSLMPNGKYIHQSQGIVYVAGETESTYSGEHPKIQSGNMLFWSRSDADEPENFPPENFRAIGSFGDKIMGFADAADTTLVFTRQTATTIQRSGSYIIFRDLGVRFGLAWDEACVSLGSMAAWVSDKSIWLYDGNSNDLPKDIGFDIRDWIIGLQAISNVRVRMGFDAVNGMLWLGKVEPTGVISECKIYSAADDAWTTRENCVLDAPVAACGAESAGSSLALYRFAGSPPNCFLAVDYTNKPVADGGWNVTSNLLTGTLGSAGSITSISGQTFASGGSNAFSGLVIHFIRPSTGAEATRVVSSSTTSAVGWDTAYVGAIGDKWIVAGIPFRLRFPPIRGDNVFLAKIVRGLMLLWDNVNLAGQDPPKYLTAKLYRNYSDSSDVGATATLKIADDVSVIDTDTSADIGATGKVIEIYLEQLDAHVAFSLIYVGAMAIIPGTIGEDFSASV